MIFCSLFLFSYFYLILLAEVHDSCQTCSWFAFKNFLKFICFFVYAKGHNSPCSCLALNNILKNYIFSVFLLIFNSFYFTIKYFRNFCADNKDNKWEIYFRNHSFTVFKIFICTFLKVIPKLIEFCSFFFSFSNKLF